MKKNDLIKFRQGARKILVKHFTTEREGELDFVNLIVGIISTAIAVSLFVWALIGDYEVFFSRIFLFWVTILFFGILGIGSFLKMERRKVDSKKVRDFLRNLYKKQNKMGLANGLEHFLNENIEFKKYSFFQRWLDVFESQEK